MAEKPILFSAPMVRAILEGRKTVTRRVVKDSDKYERLLGIELKFPMQVYKAFNSPCEPGNILWVRETWTKLYYVDEHRYTHYDQPMYYYAADGVPDITLIDSDGFEDDGQRIRWRPSIHMPREAARIWLRVTGVRVERLQEIDEDGAIAEGCSAGRFETTGGPWGVEDDPDEWTAWEDFSHVWDSTIKPADRGRYGWDANPWVWVIAFERIERPVTLT